uniref:Triple gene block 1 n=1 Tax=Foveavirus mali TaxID=35350 RepID=A0A8K1JAH6_9VIRU|nr:triple gene block 1 [Apple stem pitting virus]
METVLSLLNEFGFERTVEPLSDPIVVHAVPGSGKTTLIKQALIRNHNIEAVTFGVPEKANIHGTYIKKARQGQRGRGNYSILDEYLSGEYSTGFNCLFSDPYQNHGDCLRAHFIGRCSHRFGRQTVQVLRDLGYNIASSKEDTVERKNIFQLVEPEGVIICLEKEVEDFLAWHRVEYKLPCQVRGATYDIVTFVHEKPLEELVGPDLFVALTRHRNKLVLVSN